MSETPHGVLQRHVAAVHDGDLDAIAADCAPDALVLTPTGQDRGSEQVRGLYAELSQALPGVALEASAAVLADDVLLLHWTATAAPHSVPDGVDTVVIRDGEISVQTISCTSVPRR